MINAQGKVFVGNRIKQNASAGWQMPQGGIDKGEHPRQAALRELLEEVGTDKVEIIGKTKDWLSYELPEHLIGKVWNGRYRGQKQKWFAAKFLGTDEDIDLNHHHKPEFNDFKWVDLEEVPDLIVEFKRGVYKQVVKEFKGLIDDVVVTT